MMDLVSRTRCFDFSDKGKLPRRMIGPIILDARGDQMEYDHTILVSRPDVDLICNRNNRGRLANKLRTWPYFTGRWLPGILGNGY